MAQAYLCRRGVPGNVLALTRQPTDAEMAVFALAGMELATVGERYVATCSCPVNGDGYWYTRRYLLDSAGAVVGSFEEENGPRGVL